MKIRASKCIIKQVPVTEQKTFLKENHIQGYVPSSVCIGLYLGERLVYLMSFGGVRRGNINYATWDLKRMCGLKDSVIYGGASKLLKYFVTNYDVGKGIVTYCDTEVFDGHTYPTIGFKYHHTNPQDYRYVKDGKTYNKQYGQKACIYRRHPEYQGLGLTERQMMEMDGFKREYHKGLVAYTYGLNPSMTDVTTKKVKCLETGQVHTKSEWAELGYHKAYDCARRTRYTCKGYHFSFESDETTLQEIELWEKESRQNQELIRRHKISLFKSV